MRKPGRKKLIALGVALLMLSGGTAAIAATQLSVSNPRQAYLNDVAKRLHVSSAALTNAMKQARIDQINAAQKAGRLTAAQANAAKRQIQQSKNAGGPWGGPGPGAWNAGPGHLGSGAWKAGQGRLGPRGCNAPMKSSTTTGTTSTATTTRAATPCQAPPGFGSRGPGAFGGKASGGFGVPGARGHGFGGPGFGPGVGFGFGFGLLGAGSAAVTDYLGISAATLRSDLASGKSLAQIASAVSGKSTAGLESALNAAVKAQLDKAVKAGWMTASQESKRLSMVSSQLSKLVNRSFKLPQFKMPPHATSAGHGKAPASGIWSLFGHSAHRSAHKSHR